MPSTILNDVLDAFYKEFGTPSRETKKVKAWDILSNLGLVVQVDQPNGGQAAYVWIPYTSGDQPIPEFALEYRGEAGRHSNTYPSPGLGRGLPALKLTIRTRSELNDTLRYIRAFRDRMPLPVIKSTIPALSATVTVELPNLPALPQARHSSKNTTTRLTHNEHAAAGPVEAGIKDGDELGRFREFAGRINKLPDRDRLEKADVLTSQFLLHRLNNLEIYYAPFDWVNTAAKVVVVGITPGWTQMEIAFREARRKLLESSDAVEICRTVKQQASFAGSMRKNLISMLDKLGLPAQLGIKSTEDLFGCARSLLHSTSAIRYPVFINRNNYTGSSPRILDSSLLRKFIESMLTDELRLVPRALVIPLGRCVSEVLEFLVSQKQVDGSRCLFGFPHPSGANGHRVAEFTHRFESLQQKLRRWKF